jgi:NDP-sugar pyrophosphorylase family protein
MTKEKIAISIDESLLSTIDKKTDGKELQSRSQAIEHYLRKGLAESLVDKAIIMLRSDQHELVLRNKAAFLKKQLDFLRRANIQKVVLTTQSSSYVAEIKKIIEKEGFETKIYESKAQNNSQALLAAKKEFTTDCLVVSGDVLNDFNVQDMIKKHLTLGKTATMGIISKAQTATEGSAIIDGDYVVEFYEKTPKQVTNIVNAGIYILSPSSLSLLDGKQNIEYELFPKLAKLRQLVGYFIYGAYEHLK